MLKLSEVLMFPIRFLAGLLDFIKKVFNSSKMETQLNELHAYVVQCSEDRIKVDFNVDSANEYSTELESDLKELASALENTTFLLQQQKEVNAALINENQKLKKNLDFSQNEVVQLHESLDLWINPPKVKTKSKKK